MQDKRILEFETTSAVNHPPPCHTRPPVRTLLRAFTLVEILVVVAILAIVIALLLPVLANVRAHGPAAACTNNLRQIQAAFLMYANDNDGRVPPHATHYGDEYHQADETLISVVPDGAAALVKALYPYAKSEAIWFCPSDTVAHTDSQEGRVNHRYTSYSSTSLLDYPSLPGENHPVTMDPTATKLNGVVVSSSSLILLSDNVWGCLPGNTILPLYSHNGRYNRLYFDGHVRSFRRESNCGFSEK